MAVDRIAYIGPDGNVFTISPDGADARRLTATHPWAGPGGHILGQGADRQVFYAWPTWSPDGTRLAASRISVQGGDVSFSLEVVDTSTGDTTRIYDNQPGTGPIAQGSPHYIYWSPDSRTLAFIASTPRELALFIYSLEDDRGPTHLTGQGPIFFSWATDSRTLLLHRGMDLLLADIANIGGNAPRQPELLGPVGGGFRAPAISHDGSKMAYVSGGDSGEALYLAGTSPLDLRHARPVMDAGAQSAFLWSPVRDELAVVDTVGSPGGSQGPFYDRLAIVGDDGASQKSIVNEPLIAFFWSPNGEKVAYVAYDQEGQVFTWKTVGREGGDSVTLAEFLPSGEFLTWITFFDQYAYSNALWSPDSSQIVFSGTLGPRSNSSDGASPEGDKTYLLEVKEGPKPRAIATSRFACWSWK
jgi:TolB protein